MTATPTFDPQNRNFVSVNGVPLHVAERGSGTPVVFCHEYAASSTSWAAQLPYFSKQYRCVSYDARGYPPSAVPDTADAYSHDILVADLEGLMDQRGIRDAYLVGAATGAGVALHLACRRPDIVKALVIVGPGAGSDDRAAWLKGAQGIADAVRSKGMAALVANMEATPQRQQMRRKQKAAWDVFLANMMALSPVGCALTMENVLMRRAPIYDLEDSIRKLAMPILVMVGDRDVPARGSCDFIAKTAPHAGLCVLPQAGHMVPMEEPELFNQIVERFFNSVEAKQWGSWTGGLDTKVT